MYYIDSVNFFFDFMFFDCGLQGSINVKDVIVFWVWNVLVEICVGSLRILLDISFFFNWMFLDNCYIVVCYNIL